MLYDHFSMYATISIIITPIVVFMGLTAGFELRKTVFDDKGNKIKLLDGRKFKIYTPKDVTELFDKLGPEDRE